MAEENTEEKKKGGLLRIIMVVGVRVSEKHSNFFIADKDAKSSALYKLVNFVKDSVFDKYRVNLQEEIIFVGDFD